MLKYLSLFSGIGSPETALKRLNIPYELVGFSEIDKYAIKSYCSLHDVSESLNLGDITQIDITQLPTDIDLITHGSPCQDFSVAGKSNGGDKNSGTRSSLMWYTIEICKVVKPKVIVWENVKNVLSNKHKHNLDKYLEELQHIGYKNYYKVLNAKDFGIPQNRERIFVVSIRKDVDIDFKFPQSNNIGNKLKDILSMEFHEKYIVKNERAKCWLHNTQIIDDEQDTPNRIGGLFDDITRHQAGSIWGSNGLAPTLDTMQGGYRQPLIISNVGNESVLRKLTPLECWRLMGFTDDEFNKVKNICSDTQLYKQAGNSIVVNVLTEIFKILLK